MQLYIYAKSGHNFGLDCVRRSAAVAFLLKEFNPILCTSDFRAGAYAKEHLEVKKYIPIDVITNLSNIMQKGDILIYDSNEVNETLLNEIKKYCSKVYKIADEIPYYIVHPLFLEQKSNQSIEKLFFYGDDDYNQNLFKISQDSLKHDLPLLFGHYFFLGSEKNYINSFSKIYDEEEYLECIKNTKYLLTGSLNTALESIFCGNSPVLLKRNDKEYDENTIKKYNIPYIQEKSLDKLILEFNNIILNYPTLATIKPFNFDKISSEIQNIITT
ncbi:hypothetical protein OZZ08_05815 [Malaciobacter mytili]|uniref:hypothetical protein n=1 Tax=Malaciobacter mytili TaxID=603050 RepID=UPI003BB0CC9C